MITSTLHAKMLKPALASLIVVSSLAFSSCQDEDFGFTKDEIRDSVYDRNFIAKYGEIDPEQSWDLSSYASLSNATTRATRDEANLTQSCEFDNDNSWFASHVKRENTWYYVDPDLVSKFTTQLPEGSNNSAMGGPFTLTSNGTFYIVPLFQGASGIESDLHMVVTMPDGTTYDKCIWDKSSYIQKQVAGSFDWNGLPQKMDYWADYGNKGENGVYKGSTLYAKGVRSMPIRCDIPKDASVEFYLHITRGHMNYRSSWGNEYDRWSANKLEEGTERKYDEPNLAFTGVKQWSSDSHGTLSKMIALSSSQFDVDDETKKKYGDNVMLIGCEDALFGSEDAVVWSNKSNYTTYKYTDNYKRGKDNENHPIKKINEDSNGNKTTVYWEGDNDMNDMIFMIVSNALPDVKRTDEIRKRYMIEDLGSVVDWDFNDVVVDMVQTTKVVGSQTTVTQKAILKHLCGTTPFELYIGEAGNVSNSVKLNFNASTTIKDYQGQSQHLSMPDNSGLIPGIQMDRDAELNIEYTLPNNRWVPNDNNIWVRVYQDKTYADRKDPDGGVNFGGTIDPNPGVNDGVINGEINSSFNYTGFVDVAFPRKGKVPRIIAVDADFKWTAEDVNIQPTLWTNVTITAAPNNEDIGTVSGAGVYRFGKEVVLTAIAKSNEYEFVEWSDGNKERTRSFVASEAVTLTAKFQHISTEDAGGMVFKKDNGGFNGYVVNDKESIRKRVEAGYNTITVVYEGGTGNPDFKLCRSTDAWPSLVQSAALTYSMTYNVKDESNGKKSVTFVLSEDELKAMAQYGFVVQDINSNTYAVTDVIWSKTPDYYTVNLAVYIDGQNSESINGAAGKAKVTAEDRGTWNKSAAFGQASYPAGQQVRFTAQPFGDYYFSHWENTKGSHNVVKTNPISIEASSDLVAYFKTKPTLTLVLDDLDKDDFDLYINGNPVTSAKIAPGETVKVKAKKNGNNTNANYKFMWTGVSGLADSDDDAEVEFIMPESNCTLNCIVLYKTTPQIRFGNDADYSGKYGTITLEWNGRTSTNTSSLFVPLGAEVKAKVFAKKGFILKQWLYSNNTTSTEYTFTRSKADSDKKEIWMPQALMEVENETWYSIRDGNGEEVDDTYYSYNITKTVAPELFDLMSSTKRTIVIVFNETRSDGLIHLRKINWNSGNGLTNAAGNLSIASNPYVEVELTEDEVDALKQADAPSIILQHTGDDLDKTRSRLRVMSVILKVTSTN